MEQVQESPSWSNLSSWLSNQMSEASIRVQPTSFAIFSLFRAFSEFLIFWCSLFKIGFIKLFYAAQLIKVAPLYPTSTDFMHQFPNCSVAFLPQLTVHFKTRNSVLTMGYEGHSQVPSLERKIRILHNRSISECGSEPTRLALPLTTCRKPIMFCASTLLSGNTLLFTVCIELKLAALIIMEML